jgi:RNA polymerase sigma factor (sigma-70 family)
MFRYAIFGDEKLIVAGVSRLRNREKEHIFSKTYGYILFNDLDIMFTYSRKFDFSNKIYEIIKLQDCTNKEKDGLYKYVIFNPKNVYSNAVKHKGTSITLFKDLPENAKDEEVYCFVKKEIDKQVGTEGSKYTLIFLQNKDEIMKYLDILDDTAKKIIELRYIENKELKEIAKILNTKPTNITQKHRLTLKKLIKHWEKEKLKNI